MSDRPPLESFLKWKLSIESPSLNYAAKAVTKNVIVAVDIPYPLIKAWHEFLGLQKKVRKTAAVASQPNQSASTSSDLSPAAVQEYTYVDLFEYCIPHHTFAITADEQIRKEVNNTLAKIAGMVQNLYAKAKGGSKREELNSKVRRFHIFEGQTLSVTCLREETEAIRDELEEWKQNYQHLEAESKQLFAEMYLAIQEKEQSLSNLQSKNEELQHYFEKIENSDKTYVGKDISEVKKKSRTLKEFMCRAKTALWFAKSFGLELESMTMNEQKTGISHTVMAEDQMSNYNGNSNAFDSLSEEEKSKVEKVLFLLDKFCVGDNFYHELTMVVDGLPKSYLVKQRRSQLNDICHITSTPGETEGAQTSFTDLLRDRVQDYVASHPHVDHVQIKISGDGARMTRNSSFILMSFALLHSDDEVMAAKGNHTIAVVKGKEHYNTLRQSFEDVFKDINSLISKKKIEVGGKSINLEFFLGGDYKFILLVMGLKGATSHYACVWCKIHKDMRWDTSFNLDHYQSPDLRRTLTEMFELVKKKKQNDKYCCEHEPLLHIELDHVVLDELHLLLRISDVLIENLVRDALDWDRSKNWDKRKCQQKNEHLQNLQAAIRSCGVSFDIWEKTNADGKGSGQYDFTSLLGSDKKKLLNELPTKLNGIIQPDTVEVVKTVWEKFREIYSTVTCRNPSTEMINDYFWKAKEWVNLFTSLGEKRHGYKRANVTPYMHAMVYHIPIFLQNYRTIKLFTGQGVEKNNDMARAIVHKKSNKWDAPADILKLESRQWNLRDSERAKRTYSKRKSSYWEHDLRENRKSKRLREKKN
ncbi:uncharacterized protein [Pocillopora verrucosa]|uniref:uncharacterized protein n=1 Tax=Pocillopora verrucosa TaxID=203993 RepID=UPI003342672A